MNTLLAITRMTLITIAALIALVLVFFASLLPVRVRRASLSLWVVVYAARVFMFLFNVRVICTELELLRQHEGLIFMNHMSYLEALGILSLTPVRFMAAVEVRRRAISGWIAARMGTIFVERDNASSRSITRDSVRTVMQLSPYPPMVVFPEGRLGDGVRLHQFRFGIFDIACEGSIPYLLCAVQFNRPDVAVWRGPRGESLMSAIWKLAKSRGKIFVDIFPLYVVHPTPQDNPRQLARNARRDVAEHLGIAAGIPE
ncbi:MAG: 1-acyl-sn-glycerol-3-phosphate acyltransferase [Caldilineaceae bacterium]|nr:1-acyl-sn-glycerol-3-phosphate acyltransferase [Caldilineaceae bacterium]